MKTHANEIKKRQQNDWNAVAPGWEKWWRTLEEGARHVSARMLQMAELQNGQRVLDIATGIGEPAVSAAHQVGSDGYVLAIDQAENMLQLARQRGKQEGLRNLVFQQLDGESLDQLEETFDVALCRWGLMFFPELETALHNIRRRLVPGGRFAAAVWSTPEKVPAISLAMNVVRTQLQLPAPAPGTPSPFSLADREQLQATLHHTGFKGIVFSSVKVSFDMPSASAYTEFTRDISAPVVALLSELSVLCREEIWAAIREAASVYAQDDGHIHMENEALCISALSG